MNHMEPLHLHGCRHDILGHYLKAIGLLRVLAKCATPENRDSDAEGWWDADKACFRLHSPKYPTREKLVDFFEKHYQPTPIFVNAMNGQAAKRSTSFSLTDYLVDAATKDGALVPKEPNSGEALAAYRDAPDGNHADIVDSIAAPRFSSNSDNPLWLSKGRTSGKGHIWSSFGEYVDAFDKLRKQKNKTSLHSLILSALEGTTDSKKAAKGKGTPFFPDAIKAYNIGSGWVTENYPFNALDYVLAVEGGFAMRGSVGRTLAANSRRFAAFPFVFDAGEELVDDGNEVKGTSSALWFPLWARPVTFAELSSFISDAQARLPGKEARFSAEFMRALHIQGVDAGFTGWQEFRFKMKISRVPWVTTGALVETAFQEDTTRLNRALQPFDESQFLDQFDMKWKGGKADSKSPHPVRAAINAAMETATRETTPHHCLDLLCAVFRACRQMAISESFRGTLPGKRARFFQPLPMEHWNHLLGGMDQPEFRIARAVASMPGSMKQGGDDSIVFPMLGSLLPLEQGRGGVWYLPETPSKHADWTGTDLCHDLAAVLSRRYLDSLTHDRPALMSSFGARLGDILAFLSGDLDDALIARWTEALSLIGWKFTKLDGVPCDEECEPHAIPPEYAALRTLLELECEHRKDGDTKKLRSQQPIALLCQRSASTLPLAVTEALRWIGIWGVPNPYGKAAGAEKPRLAGRDIVSPRAFAPSTEAARLAAAVCIPLHWRDRHALYRAVSLPQSD
jgi:CRISPR-associated protein Csx17